MDICIIISYELLDVYDWMFVLLEVTSYWMFVIGCLYIESYPGRDALLDMINGSNMKTAAVGSGKGVGCCRSSDAKPSPSKSSPPPATEEEEDVLEELLSSPPCPPVPQVFGLGTVPAVTARNRRGSELPRAWQAGGLSLE